MKDEREALIASRNATQEAANKLVRVCVKGWWGWGSDEAQRLALCAEGQL